MVMKYVCIILKVLCNNWQNIMIPSPWCRHGASNSCNIVPGTVVYKNYKKYYNSEEFLNFAN